MGYRYASSWWLLHLYYLYDGTSASFGVINLCSGRGGARNPYNDDIVCAFNSFGRRPIFVTSVMFEVHREIM
ncbi:MAG: hypothetical protein ACLSB7_11075 [Parabacteroides distasonis]